MAKFHLIMPMAGRGSRFSGAGFDLPKPLLKIYDKPFFYWATQSVAKFNDLASLTFVVLKEHVDQYRIDQEILSYYPESKIVVLNEVTSGAIVTCEKGLAYVNDDLPIVFNDCDHLFKSTCFNECCETGIDKNVSGILLTFKSNEPVYSYVGYDENENVIRTAEKEVISNDAICGCYYFASKDVFRAAMEEYLGKCQYSEYFVSGAYNVMIENGLCIRSIDTDFHVPFGVPEEYEKAKESSLYKELI